MGEDRIELYEDQPIRTAWDEANEEWYFSIVDVCVFLLIKQIEDMVQNIGVF